MTACSESFLTRKIGRVGVVEGGGGGGGGFGVIVVAKRALLGKKFGD
jgi:hypothetical protein